MFQQQLINGQSGHDWGQSNRDQHGQELPGLHSNGQVSLSLDGQLPPNWPSQFPVPAGAKAAGSGSLGGSSSATLVAAYTTSESDSDAFAFYKDNSKLTTSDQKSVGTGAHYVGRAKITAPYTGSVTVVSHSGTTYIVIVLTSSPRSSSPSASATAS